MISSLDTADHFAKSHLNASTTNKRILITGARGQIGQILTAELAKQVGVSKVFATDIHPDVLSLQSSDHELSIIQYAYLDVCDFANLQVFIQAHGITHIYHLAAILSAKGEQAPLQTWQINMQSLLNILECCRLYAIKQLFYPSTIAVFGEYIEQALTNNLQPLFANTVYGISKAAGENWCAYYRKKYDLDIRSLRYPGVIGWQTLPGGGTTDYAIDIFHQLRRTLHYTCFLAADRALPMIYMEDAIRATLELMAAPKSSIQLSVAYNIAGCSFTPAQLFTEIQKHIAGVKIHYLPDYRDAIAKTWPWTIDDQHAQMDWGWQAKFDLAAITQDMLMHIH